MEYTKDQQKVISIRNNNVLVSAAAGSGKTAVLVERIIGLITDEKHPVDIDRLLVVTFTNAAASEMRERIHRAILERLEHDPENANLQRQSILINHAMITTIDSFCKFILMNHFQDISLDPGFSIGDPGKMKLLQKEALKNVMENAYSENYDFYEDFNRDFMELTHAFSQKGMDAPVEDMIHQIFQFVMSEPYPEKWMMKSLGNYEISDVERFQETEFYKSLCDQIKIELQGVVHTYGSILDICREPDGPVVYEKVISEEKDMVARGAEQSRFSDLYNCVRGFDFKKLPTAKKDSCDEDLKNRAKFLRDLSKKRIAELEKKYLFQDLDDFIKDLNKAGKMLKPLVYLTKAYMEEFAEEKRKENVIDFADMEHFALKILVDEDGNPTETAKWYQSHFETVMIDEYQDSNEVQELLLSVISRESGENANRFMVGDMKQSIYKFRMARPEIFLDKYKKYAMAECEDCTRIDLKQNFRSRKTVLHMVNHVFFPLMQASVGGIDYDEDAMLYPGAAYPENDEQNPLFKAELLLYETKGEEGEKAELKADTGEARMIAKKVVELLRDGKVTDKITGELRSVRCDDIVILVRSVGGLTDEIQNMLKREGIKTAIPSKTGYFDSSEIQVLLQYINVCVNPYNDISLVGVLKSPLFQFSDAELVEISLLTPVSESGGCTETKGEEEKNSQKDFFFYEKLCASESEKAKMFLAELQEMRQLAKTESVYDFLYQVIRRHHYDDYMSAFPNGGSRMDNIRMLLEQAKSYEQSRRQGIFGFSQYMKQLKKYEIDYGSGNEEGANAVSLMTIHKSKGLEFPICIVAGLSKKFNKSDLKGPLLLHPDLGIGLEYRDYGMRVRRNTIMQKWIATKQRIDSMGEELRVLYVALTRAKEKCILTGSILSYQDEMMKCAQLVADELRKNPYERVVDSQALLECGNYLKQVLYVLAIYEDHPEFVPKVSVYHEDDLQINELEESLEKCFQKDGFLELLKKSAGEKNEQLLEKITFHYPHDALEGLYNKTSVSTLKHAAIHEDEQTQVMFATDEVTETVPDFMKGEEKVLGATRGTIYHRLMELLDFKAYLECISYKNGKVSEIDVDKMIKILHLQIDEILSEKLMKKEDLSLVREDRILKFLQSPLAIDMMMADKEGKLYVEQPFVIEIPAQRMDEKFPKEETVLIQGIIDAFYEKDGKIYLMDYKTDRIDTKEALVSRYKVQLDYYSEAIEKTTGKSVEAVYIYSFHFSDTIKL